MRLLFIVLVLLNLLALASTQGWLGAPVTRGEPERLSNQLNPERIVLHAPQEQGPAPAAAEPPPASAPPLPAPPEPIAATAEPAPEAAAPAPDTPASDRPVPGAPAPDTSAPDTPLRDDAPVSPQACIAYGGLAEAQADALVAAARSSHPEVRVDRSATSTPTAWWVRIPPAGGREGAERRIEGVRALGVNEYFIIQEPGANQYAVSLGLFKTEAKAQQHLAFLRTKGVRDAAVAPRTAAVHKVELRAPAGALATLEKSPAAVRSGGNRSECAP